MSKVSKMVSTVKGVLRGYSGVKGLGVFRGPEGLRGIKVLMGIKVLTGLWG